MVNKNYKKGAYYEQDLCREARNMGCYAVRSAGSQSPFDLIILDPTTRVISLVQAKRGSKIRKAERERFLQLAQELSGQWALKLEVKYKP